MESHHISSSAGTISTPALSPLITTTSTNTCWCKRHVSLTYKEGMNYQHIRKLFYRTFFGDLFFFMANSRPSDPQMEHQGVVPAAYNNYNQEFFRTVNIQKHFGKQTKNGKSLIKFSTLGLLWHHCRRLWEDLLSRRTAGEDANLDLGINTGEGGQTGIPSPWRNSPPP